MDSTYRIVRQTLNLAQETLGKGDTPPRLMDFMHRSIVTATALLFVFPYIGLATRHQSARARRKTPATKRGLKQYGHHKGRGCWLTPCLSYEQQLCSQALNCPTLFSRIMSKRSVRYFHFYHTVCLATSGLSSERDFSSCYYGFLLDELEEVITRQLL